MDAAQPPGRVVPGRSTAAGYPLTLALGRQPAWRLAVQFAGLAAKEAGHRIAHALGARRYAALDERVLRLPESSICQQALEWVAAVSPPFLLNHCIRGYVFGVALGARDRILFDPELLFLACVMHDLGLTPEHDGADDFELEGARAAHAWMLDRGESDQRAAVIHEAIALHTSVGRALKGGPEVMLTHLGVGVDVIGLRAEDFRPEALEMAAARWPRHDFKRRFPPLIQDQAARKPCCSIAGPLALGFAGKIASAPFTS